MRAGCFVSGAAGFLSTFIMVGAACGEPSICLSGEIRKLVELRDGFNYWSDKGSLWMGGQWWVD